MYQGTFFDCDYLPFPNKKYSIIYADPPWQYRDKALAGYRGACCNYKIQSEDYLKKLPIQEISNRDCVLFLWVTMPKLNECFDLIDSWGFIYKTCAFTWVKTNKHKNSLFLGMGRWTRANAELCLLATKGKPKRINAGIQSVVISERRRHSEKPDQVRDLIVKLCGNIPRIELFARKKVFGWDSWGDQI